MYLRFGPELSLLSFSVGGRRPLAEDKDFRQRMQRIGDLVQKIEDIADPAVRATAKELVQLLMEMHGTGLEKILEITFHAGNAGVGIIDELACDPLVSSLLILYGLHPEALGSRVAKALDRIRPGLRKHGSEIELLAVDEGVVRVRIETGGHACGSTLKGIRSTVEEAIYESAPDITSLFIEGPEAQASSGFVALEKLLGDHLSMPVVDHRG
jgi:Fe-S cluster biogenesis protein NfuA